MVIIYAVIQTQNFYPHWLLSIPPLATNSCQYHLLNVPRIHPLLSIPTATIQGQATAYLPGVNATLSTWSATASSNQFILYISLRVSFHKHYVILSVPWCHFKSCKIKFFIRWSFNLLSLQPHLLNRNLYFELWTSGFILCLVQLQISKVFWNVTMTLYKYWKGIISESKWRI